MVGRGQEKAPVAFDRSQRLCRCAEVGAGKISLLSNTRAGDEGREEKGVFCSGRIECRKRSTRPECKRCVLSSFPELVSRNTSAGGRGNAGCMQAGRPIGVPSSTLIHKNRYWKFGSERHRITSPNKEARRNCGLRQAARKKPYLCREGDRKLRPTDTSRMARARSLASRRFVT